MKISRTNKKTSLLLLYLVLTSCLIQICRSQKNRSKRWDLDGDFETVKNYETLKNFEGAVLVPERTLCSGNSLEDCENDRDNLIYSMPLRKHQPTHNAPVSSTFITKKTAPLVQSRPGLTCPCVGEHTYKDLGLHYYPRYVPTVVCKPGGCYAGFQCRPKKYNIAVLRKKGIEEAIGKESNSDSFPEILKEFFIPETHTVAVACECAP